MSNLDAFRNLGDSYALAPDLVLTADGPQRDVAIEVAGGRIARLAPADAVADAIRLPGRAVIPGFVDAHTHLGQAFGKAFVFGEPSQIWQRIWGPVEGSLTPDMMRVSATFMMVEALRGGFTTIVNFAMADEEKTAAVHAAAAATGIRLVSCAGAADLADFPQLPGRTPRLSTIADAVKRAERHIAMCDGPRVTPSICCSGIQGATPELLATFAALCAQRGVLFQFHSNEHFPEVHHAIVRHGRRPIELLADHGALGRHVLLHHCTLVSDREVGLLAETGTAVSYNPVASLWKGDGIAPALQMRDRGVRFGLGTDSTRSDAFRLLDAAEACQRFGRGLSSLDFSCGAGWTWVDAATRGGADACGLGTTTGTLEPGKAADFLVLDMRWPEVAPSWDFEWELVRLYGRDQIDAVIVDGRTVSVAGRPVGVDMDALMREEIPRAVAAVNASGAVRRHGPSGQHRPRRPMPPGQV
jgi:cytosine/adenosine deaminase-related metal-dependent hydrolase